MKRILYSACIGSLALALNAGAEQDKRPERARPQQRTATVHAARPTNTHVSARHFNSTAHYQQRSYTARRSNTASNRPARPASSTPATARERNLDVNRT